MRKIILRLIPTLILCLATVAWGQTGNGRLTGRITSAQGTPVASATVTVTNTATNTSQKVLTGADGSFTVEPLPAGTYRIDVVMAGYKRTSQQDLVLNTGNNTVNLTLQAGNANETVEIRGHSPVTQTQGGEVGVDIGTRMVRELPVQDRNFQQLSGLQTGITPPTPAIDPVRDPDRNRFFSTNGQAPTNNEWTTDGVYNTEPFRNTAIRVIPNEAIQEMNIVTANQSVDKGFTGGAFVASVVPSGTNGIHGSLFEFWNGNILNSRNFFNPSGNLPHWVSNRFGATVGGAIVPDRTFFYGSYQGLYQNGAQTQLTTVPVAGALNGNFSGIPGLTLFNPGTGIAATGAGRTPFGGNIIPGGQINSFAAGLVSQFPAANLPGFVNNYAVSVPEGQHTQKFDGRIDQHVGDHTLAFVRYGFTNAWAYQASPLGNALGAGMRDRLLGQNAIVSLQHDFGGALMSDLRLGYNRYDQELSPWSTTASPIGINITGFAPIGSAAFLPEHPIDNTFDATWSWDWHRGMNDLTFGVDVMRIHSNGFLDTPLGSLFGPAGTAYFGPGVTSLNSPTATMSQYGSIYNSLAAFLLGQPNQIGVSNYFVLPSIRQWEIAGWVGDKITVFPCLTIDFGLRYEAYSPLTAAHTGGQSFFNSSNNSFTFAGVGPTPFDFGQQWDTDALAPRFGFALRATNKTVIRGGYAMQYFQVPYMYSGFMAPVYGAVAGLQGGFTAANLNGTALQGTRFGSSLSGTVPVPSPGLANSAVAGNLPAAVTGSTDTPYVQTFSLQLQQEFYWSTMLSVGYVGTMGRHLPSFYELNAAAPGTGVAGLPFASMGRTASTLFFNNGLTNNYNSLQASLSKRFQGGISFLASYTWSKALGYTSSNGFLLNPTNLRADYGPLDYDRQHVLQISHLWEIPFGMHGNHILGTILGGWQLNGIFTWATGTPLTITADPLLCACPGNTAFANLNTGANPVMQNGRTFLNASAFSVPSFGQAGNLGRGAIHGPGYRNYDLSLFKNFHVRDRFNLQLRGEAYNLTNTPRFLNPVTNISSPDFGQQVTTINGAFGRQVQVGARLLF